MTKGLVLGTDFISDVLLVSVSVTPPLTLIPSLLATDVALRTISEALTKAACTRLELEATELLFSFEVNGIASDKFALIRMEGREAVSELYRFDVDLVSADPDIDPEKIVNQPALVVIDLWHETLQLR